MNWKIGQKLVCIADGVWHGLDGTTFTGINNGDIVTFDGYNIDGRIKYFIYLKEVFTKNLSGKRIAFDPRHFRPLIGESAKSELISSFKEVT